MNLFDKITATEKKHSLFENEIRKIKPLASPVFLKDGKIHPVSFEKVLGEIITGDKSEIGSSFPHTTTANKFLLKKANGVNETPKTGMKIAVLFSGGPAAGGHNIIAGVKRVLGEENELLGVKAGPKGLIEGDLFPIEDSDIDNILNTGGFDFLGSDRTKIKRKDQFRAVENTCDKYDLDAIIVIGGDDSNTNAAVLAERLYSKNIQVIGVPKTIDGDLQVDKHLPISFGFDTATKIYAEMVGNILQDTPSSRKYWHFVKLMGRSASHVALEVALQVKPAITFISEEIKEKNISLDELVDGAAKVIIERGERGVFHGVIIIPEGLIEFIPEMTLLINELNNKITECGDNFNQLEFIDKKSKISSKMSSKTLALFNSLPSYIQEMLLFERDSHGNLQVSLIPTEKMLIDMISEKIKKKANNMPFKTLSHFFGYEGRCGAPSLFDAIYCFNLGLTAGSLVLSGMTGYMAAMTDLTQKGNILAIPLTGLIHIEKRYGKNEFVIEKALVKTDSPAFKYFESRRDYWKKEDLFSSPGPRQIWGPTAKQIPLTVSLNQQYEKTTFNF